MIVTYPRVAFTGFAGAGKDEAARPLIEAGFERRCFGDIIKGQLAGLVSTHLDISPFTEDRAEKAQIRRTLEAWGEDNYANISTEFFSSLPLRCVNTRLCRLPEAERWIMHGGIIVDIYRPGVRPATQWERDLAEVWRACDIPRFHIVNDGTVEDLHRKIADLCLGPAGSALPSKVSCPILGSIPRLPLKVPNKVTCPRCGVPQKENYE